jgi:truncated hemoglobin YjbI
MKTEEFILETVENFYAKATTDFLIGYHFRHITDFETHIPRIATFWDIQLLGAPSRPLTEPFDVINKHMPLMIKPGEVGRWVVLFKQTLEEQGRQYPEFLELIQKWMMKLEFFREKFLTIEKLYPKNF